MMTYDKSAYEMNRCAIFKIDIDEKVTNHIPRYKNIKKWLKHYKTRIPWRLYYFCDSVLREGFVDPIIIWGNIQKKVFSVSPGKNRVLLAQLLPERPLKGWVVDFHCKNRKEYEGIFTNIQPLHRDEKGNRDLIWRMQHRSIVPDKTWEDQFDLHPYHNLFNTTIPKKDAFLPDKWDFFSRWTGFTPWVDGEKFYSIGTTHSKQDHYEILDVLGFYQLTLVYFFDYDPCRWNKLYYRPKYESKTN